MRIELYVLQGWFGASDSVSQFNRLNEVIDERLSIKPLHFRVNEANLKSAYMRQAHQP